MTDCDLVIIGAGPAGLSAAINAASEGLSTAVLEASRAVGGQAHNSSRIENYFGFANGLSGPDLIDAAKKQALRLGAEIHTNSPVIDLRWRDGHHVVTCSSGHVWTCRTALIASGVEYRKLDAPGVDKGLRGIHYGAPPLDASEFLRRDVYIVGGANSAGQAAVHLAQQGAYPIIVARSPLEKSMSQYLIERIEQLGIRVRVGARIAAVTGDHNHRLENVVVADDEGVRWHAAAALYVFIGAAPHVEWARVEKDTRGFVNGPQTDLPGVFVAGDVRSGSVKRVAAAVGEGSTAVAAIHQYLDQKEAAHV